MAGDVIGSAVIEVTADASGLSAGIAQATQAVKGFEAAAAGSGARAGAAMSKANKDASITSAQLTREQERLISTINNYSQTLGKSRGEVLEFRAAQSGITSQVQAQIAAIRAQEAALKSGGAELNRYGVSAKQNAAALRGVPAQLTDIVTSLQGGQAPLTVLLQQGGQLKDMFGGVVPAARALGGALLGLVNPYTLAAAGAAALAYAYSQGSRESDGYARALILTGNSAGTTADQLQTMAMNIDASVGTQYEAAEALAALAETGQVAGSSLEKFGETAVRVQKAIGVSVADTAKQFAELGKDPVKASERLNETMNYLTLAVYDQIKAAQENGREQEAANIAQNAYADALQSRTKRLEENLGVFQRAWRALASDAKEAWDEVLGIGRPQTMVEGLADAQRRLDFVRSNGGNAAPIEQEIASRSRRMVRDMDAAAEQAERARSEKEKIDARKRTDALAKSTRDRAQIRTDERNAYVRDAKLLNISAEDQAKQLALIDAKYKDKKTAAPKVFQDDAATKYLMQLRETEASLAEQLTQTEKLTASQRELAKFEQQIADIKEKRTLTAEQRSLLASQDALRTQIEKNVGIENEVKAREKALKVQKEQEEAQKRFTERAAQIQDQIENTRTSREEGYSRTLEAFGQSEQERQRLEDQRQLYRENERLQAQLTKATPKELLGSDQYIAEMVKIKAALDQSLADHNAYYDALRQRQGDWVNGATRALSTYAEEATNVAKHTEEVFSNAFKGLEDQLTNLFTGKTVDVKGLLTKISEDLTRGFVKENITGPLAKAGNDYLGSGVFGGTGERGGSISNPLYVRSVDVASGFAPPQTTGGSSSLLSSILGIGSSIFGGFGNTTATALANATGTGLDGLFNFTNNFSGRAGGGFVGSGSVHEVVENGPELLTVGNKTLLMMGKQSGNVTPGGGAPVTVVNHWSVGDVPTTSMLREAVANSERRIAGQISRSRQYGGALS